MNKRDIGKELFEGYIGWESVCLVEFFHEYGQGRLNLHSFLSPLTFSCSSSQFFYRVSFGITYYTLSLLFVMDFLLNGLISLDAITRPSLKVNTPCFSFFFYSFYFDFDCIYSIRHDKITSY